MNTHTEEWNSVWARLAQVDRLGHISDPEIKFQKSQNDRNGHRTTENVQESSYTTCS